jgi:VWFA-related protein
MGRAAFILAWTAFAAAQDTPVFRTSTADVRVDVMVREGKRLIPGLVKEDFEVRDEGVIQAISYFGRESEPQSMVLLLDVSGSMTKHIVQMAQTARESLKFLSAGDRVLVMAYGRRTHRFGSFTEDYSAVERDIRRVTKEADVGSGTATNAAIVDAANALKPETRGRRAVLIVTDNQGLNYQVSDEDVLRALAGAEVVLNAIVVGSGETPVERKFAARNPDFSSTNVFKLSEQTGGEAVRAAQAGRAFPDMMERIRTRYTLAYRAPEASPGSFRRIEVRLVGAAARKYPRAEVRARNGYWVK